MTLGSKESATHFRIATHAVEFNLFARDQNELETRKSLLVRDGFKVVTMKMLDTPPTPVRGEDALREGLELFNQERFWESHETLEQIWRVSKGAQRDVVQSLILTAAAFVHYQKGEPEICLSVLKRARAKMDSFANLAPVSLEALRRNVDEILASRHVVLFTLPLNRV